VLLLLLRQLLLLLDSGTSAVVVAVVRTVERTGDSVVVVGTEEGKLRRGKGRGEVFDQWEVVVAAVDRENLAPSVGAFEIQVERSEEN
jgi:hypothetical protein